MRKILDFLNAKMVEPTLYGWYHLLCWGIVITVSIIVIFFRRKISVRFVNNFLLFMGIAFLLFEIYKIIIMTYDDNGLTEFMWYIFPFQFCSTPMYLSIIAGSIRKGKVYDYLISYLATYSLFAGLAVMALPTTVFISIIGVNIQTMFVHGGMVIIGILLWVTNTARTVWKTLLKGSVIFAIVVLIAMVLNVIWYFFGIDATFNMFYISPWGECNMPILDVIQANAPYVVFLLSYFLGFALCSGIVLAVVIFINKLYKNKENKNRYQ